MSQDNLQELFSFVKNDEVRLKLEGSRDRISRAYDELFKGYAMRAEDVLNDVVHVENYNGLVEMRDIQFYSMCEHHFAPYFGSIDIVYQPNKVITGLGKLVRLARDVHGRRLQIQELMTRDICSDVMRVLDAKGCFVRSRAKHLCVCSRGPSDAVTETVCTYALGSLSSLSIDTTR